MIDRLEEVVSFDREMLEYNSKRFIERADPFILGTHRLFAIADYLKTRNPEIFSREMLIESEYLLKLYERYGAGEKVSSCFLDDDTYRNLWNALASGNWSISYKLMEHIYKYNKDLSKSTPFDRYFNYMFQITILDVKHDKNVFKEMREVFLKKYKSYAGYPVCFEAIYNKNNEAFEAGFKEVMKGHRILCRRGAEFGDTEDEIIAIWPLGLINLARMKGMDVSVDDELVPKDLLAECASH